MGQKIISKPLVTQQLEQLKLLRVSEPESNIITMHAYEKQ